MAPSFEDRVQALPPEFFNGIYDLVFAPPKEVSIDESYQPHKQLKVSKSTR
jgi:hypothetical protein